jgi:two-component system sensor histidine kinase EvgS
MNFIPGANESENRKRHFSRKQTGGIFGNGLQLTMINNMLDCSKLNEGQLPLQPRPTDLAVFTSELSMLLTPLLQEKNLRLEIDQPTALPRLNIDPGRTRQILLNRIGNAIKYSDGSLITLAVLWKTAENRRGCLTLKVSDQGQGIPREEQKRIFEPFVQQQQHSGAGTGLGLFITMRLVKLMNGSIELKSESGKGSCFTVTPPEIAYD